jgi:hypothetical protein
MIWCLITLLLKLQLGVIICNSGYILAARGRLEVFSIIKETIIHKHQRVTSFMGYNHQTPAHLLAYGPFPAHATFSYDSSGRLKFRQPRGYIGVRDRGRAHDKFIFGCGNER